MIRHILGHKYHPLPRGFFCRSACSSQSRMRLFFVAILRDPEVGLKKLLQSGRGELRLMKILARPDKKCRDTVPA